MQNGKIQVKLALFAAFLCLAVVIPHKQASAQGKSSKPNLAAIILDEDTSDKQAVAVVEKFYNDWIKASRFKGELGDVIARFIPIQKKGSKDRFIYAIIQGETFGGCYAKGCRTIILHKKPNSNEWIGIFNAFVQNAWYDVASQDKHPANLIFSSDMKNQNPGVWVWNGTGYKVVNNK